MHTKSDEFYIGWQENAPERTGRKVRRTVWFLVAVVVLVSGGLVLSQQPFARSVYEINRLSTLEGVLIAEPIPCLKVQMDAHADPENQFQRIMLVGFGKRSAQPAIERMENALGKSLDGVGVRLEGKMIYYDGKAAFELTEGAKAFKGYVAVPDGPSYIKRLGQVTLRGEILDPKCYLGVMRPGEGKPHRSCAIRCIEGGIPVFFKTATPDSHTYFYALDENGRPINQKVAPFVADFVQLCGAAEQWDDWYVVKVDMDQGFTRLLPHWAKTDSRIPLCNTLQ
ncbi:MAG: hypothetical protein KBG02_05440 [Haliscomenobacter sp.]|nr:hypothetical protein [Haliscomenobacter sp.]MBP9076284.1 hypothetical protein [Haliscomenobacter sp.]MBP9874765.1 hypothetical protein [Haliscomenobacter sp.]